jgi:hypothetical protein
MGPKKASSRRGKRGKGKGKGKDARGHQPGKGATTGKPATAGKAAAQTTLLVTSAAIALPPPPTEICYPLKYPPRYDETSLGVELSTRIAGRPADGSTPIAGAARAAKVIWVDAGDEVLVHLDSLRVALRNRLVVVSIDLECDQTGRTPLVCTFALGDSTDPAGLFAVTNELPRGNGLLAARWGAAVQAAVWNSLLGLVTDHAGERNLAPLGLLAVDGALSLRAGDPILAPPPVAGTPISSPFTGTTT